MVTLLLESILCIGLGLLCFGLFYLCIAWFDKI